MSTLRSPRSGIRVLHSYFERIWCRSCRSPNPVDLMGLAYIFFTRTVPIQQITHPGGQRVKTLLLVKSCRSNRVRRSKRVPADPDLTWYYPNPLERPDPYLDLRPTDLCKDSKRSFAGYTRTYTQILLLASSFLGRVHCLNVSTHLFPGTRLTFW